MDRVEEAIARIGDDVDPKILEGINADYRVETEEGKAWGLAVRDGHVSLHEPDGEADFTIRGEQKDIERIMLGEQDMFTAGLQGRIQFDGDIHAGQQLVTLLRAAYPNTENPGR